MSNHNTDYLSLKPFMVIPFGVKQGKTTTAENLAIRYAHELDRPTLYIDSERKFYEFYQSCGEKFQGSSNKHLSDIPLYFSSCIWTSFNDVVNIIRTWVMEWVDNSAPMKQPCVVIDYLQYKVGTDLDNMIGVLEDLTNELKISMVVMIQTNRSGSQKEEQ